MRVCSGYVHSTAANTCRAVYCKPRKVALMPINAGLLDNPKSERVRRVADLASAKHREKSGRFLIEGPQSVREAVRWRPDLVQDVFVETIPGIESPRVASSALQSIIELSQDSTIYVHMATAEVMHHISSNAQGIVAVGNLAAMRTDTSDLALAQDALVAAFWQVRDPGNAGTVIRTADAAGCAAVVFVDECVDPLNPKVIRSTAGSLFHIPVIRLSVDETLSWARQTNMTITAADIHGTESNPPVDLPDMLAESKTLQRRRMVLFGNEARGLPTALIQQVGGSVRIPMYGKAESLNLAGSAAVALMGLAMSSHVVRI